MRRIDPPNFHVSNVIDRLLDGVASAELRVKLKAARNRLVEKEIEYRERSNNLDWWQFEESAVAAGLTNTDLRDLYRSELSHPDGSAFSFYSRIKSSSPNDKCPFCGVGVVSSIDHYLPKGRYTDVCITPLNLIPACNDCNKFKHISKPTSSNDQFIHPYFDSFDDHQWVRGHVENAGAPVVNFFVDSVGRYKDDEERLKSHFSRLRLARLYGSNAGEQLTTEKHILERCSQANGLAGVRQHLEEQARRYERLSRNSWQAAFYNALRASEWFIEEGIAQIPS